MSRLRRSTLPCCPHHVASAWSFFPDSCSPWLSLTVCNAAGERPLCTGPTLGMLVLPRLLPLFALRLPIIEVLLSYLHTFERSRGAEMQPVASKLWGTLCNQLCSIWSQLCDDMCPPQLSLCLDCFLCVTPKCPHQTRASSAPEVVLTQSGV